MTKDKTLQELEGKIRELCPELMKLSFGCRVHATGAGRCVIGSDYSLDGKILHTEKFCDSCPPVQRFPITEIIGHPITLESVLELLPNFAYSGIKGFIEFHEKPQHFTRKAVYWQLNKPLDQQQPETITFLHNLICNND